MTVIRIPPEDFDVTFGLKPDQKESDADRCVLRDALDQDWVTPRICVGSFPYRPEDVQSLLAMRMTHVLCCELLSNEKAYQGTGITFLHAPTEDGGIPRPGWFERGVRFAVDALAASPTNRIYVHCAAGQNRGPGMAYAILRARGLPHGRASAAVLSNRRGARNLFFRAAHEFIEREWRP